jgi:ABC-type bacteriocin/lantibiotic exporter with double-glycine peptidase domain
MNHKQLSLITEKLTTFYEQEFNHFTQKSPLENQQDYADDVSAFIIDLTQELQRQNILLVENYIEPENFKVLIGGNLHPIIFFDESSGNLTPIIASRTLRHKEDFFWKISDTSISQISDSQNFKPNLIKDNPDINKNNKVRFLTIFPLENISKEHSSVHHLSPMKRLFRMLAAEKKDIYTIYVYALVSGAIGLTLPLGIQAIISLISGGLVFSSVYVLVAIVIAGIIISGILQIYQQTLVEVLQRRVFAKAAFEFTYRIPRIRAEALLKYYAPELMNRFFDILTIQKALPKILIDITAAVIQISFGIILLALYHPFFIAFGVLAVAIVTITIYLNSAKGLETSILESKYKYRVAQWLEDLARTLYAFKSAGSTNMPIQKMDYLVNGYLKYRKKHFKVLLILFGNAVFFKVFVTGVLLILGTSLVIDRQITLGQFVASEIIIVLVVNSVEKLISSTDVIFDLLTAVDKMGHITDLPLETDKGLKYDFHAQNHGISVELKNMSYKYQDAKKYVLKNINLEIKPNESVCITGTNGSGKETLLKILSAIYTDYEGGISYNGLSIRDIELNSIRDGIERNLSSDLIFDGTLLENIVMGRTSITLNDVHWGLNNLNMTEAIAELSEGLSTTMIAGGKRFSESFIAKLSVVRCVVEKPKLLMVTDIYRELHKSDRMKVAGFLTDKNNPWTLLTISNDAAIMAACDRVIVLNEGEIVMDGSYQKLLQNPHFQEIID